MIINSAEVVESGETVKIQSLIEYSGKKEYLWYSFPKKYKQYLTTEKLDGFLVGSLLLAMKLGEDIEVKGAISEKLYFNLTQNAIEILQILLPGLKKINVTAQCLDKGKNAVCEGAVATGFSGGVDSFCTIHDHYFNAVSPGYKITHLVLTNVGSHNEWDSKLAKKLFNLRYEMLKGYPSEFGLGFIPIDSNLTDILRMSFEETHVLRSVSTVLMLQKLLGKYYYSSSNQYKDCFFGPHYDMSVTEPALVHLLSTETFECISAGCQYSRVEKTRRVVNVPKANHWLNVCVYSLDGKNCSMCYKCCRTLLTLEMLGDIEDFSHVFDLDKYRKARTGYVVKLLATKNKRLMNEIKDYAQTVGYSFKPWQVVAAKFYHPKIASVCMPLLKFVKSLVKKR